MGETIIGTDEAFKGDSFGGIVVAGVKADEKERQLLINLGVMDSKKLTDIKIGILAPRIMENFKWHAEVLLPEEYNKELEHNNLTVLLNKLHKKCYSRLQTPDSKHVVDKYPGCSVGDIAETKAESHYVEVAAASILARYLGLEQFKFLSKRAGFTIPKGSTHVTNALERLKREKQDFSMLTKLHFKNVSKIYK